MKKILLMILMLLNINAYANDIELVAPKTSGGMPLMDAIKARRSGREFSKEMLKDNHLSELLWVTWGISDNTGKRTIPTARNLQDIELFVALESGVYKYDAKENKLIQLNDIDVRPLLSKDQFFAKDAPVHLLFVTKDKKYGEMHAGSMYQNTSLYAAANDINMVVRGWYDKSAIKELLKLDEETEVVITAAIGYKG